MKRTNIPSILVLASVILIPQLLFWWLTPENIPGRQTVYVFGTILTVGLPLMTFLAYHMAGLRKSAGLGVVTVILDVTAMIVSAILLATNASPRTCVFVFMIMILAFTIFLAPFFVSSVKREQNGVIPIIPEEVSVRYISPVQEVYKSVLPKALYNC